MGFDPPSQDSMKVSLSRAIFFLLITLPLSFKIKVSEEILVYPQDLILPAILLFFLFFKSNGLSWLNKNYFKPYYYLLAGLTLVGLLTLFSFINIFSVGGLLKTFKYLVYGFAILLVSKYHFSRFIASFIHVGMLTVGITLAIFFYHFSVSGVTVQEFYHRSMWLNEIMPTGFSNTYLNMDTFKFERLGGNHGIYGSYLVLLYLTLVGYTKYLNKGFNLRTLLKLLLIIFNLALLTSRETFLIFLVVNLYIFKDSIRSRIKSRDFIFVGIFIIGICGYLLFSETELVIISKIRYTINSFLEGGEEGNISLRFNVWKLTLLSFLLNPWHLLIGYGYNTPNYESFLEQTNQYFSLNLKYPTVPESFFFFFLAYGGILCLLLALLFFLELTLKTYQIRRTSILAGTFFIFTLTLFVTNNTGGSMLSDLLFTQYSLVYIFLQKGNEKD